MINLAHFLLPKINYYIIEKLLTQYFTRTREISNESVEQDSLHTKGSKAT